MVARMESIIESQRLTRAKTKTTRTAKGTKTTQYFIHFLYWSHRLDPTLSQSIDNFNLFTLEKKKKGLISFSRGEGEDLEIEWADLQTNENNGITCARLNRRNPINWRRFSFLYLKNDNECSLGRDLMLTIGVISSAFGRVELRRRCMPLTLTSMAPYSKKISFVRSSSLNSAI